MSSFMKNSMMLLSASFITLSSVAYAQETTNFKPAIVYDVGTKMDRSFNQAAYEAAEKYKAEHGINFSDAESRDSVVQEQIMRRYARSGYNPIVSIGFQQAPIIERLAPEFPNSYFAIIDISLPEMPNTASYVFRDNEGSFLVGAIAAMKTGGDTFGFIGGMDIPTIHAFECGFLQGVQHVNPDSKLLVNYAGVTPAAWKDAPKGKELALSQISQGAEVIYAAAGLTGTGAYQAAKEAGIYAIGVDSNQNHLQPGTMLTSMVKGIGAAQNRVFDQVRAGKFESGQFELGLAEGGVDWAYDDYNKHLFSEEELESINELKQAIIDGEIVVKRLVGKQNGQCIYEEPEA